MNSSEYASHPIHDLVSRLMDLARLPEFTDPDLLNDEHIASALDTNFAVVSIIHSLLEKTPATLVSSHGLSQLQNGLQNVFNELSSFQSNKNQGHIQNSIANLEQTVMRHLWAFGPLQVNEEVGSGSGLINQTALAARDAMRQVTDQKNALASVIQDLSQQVQDSHFRLESLAESVVKQKAEASSVVAVVQQQYAEKEAERILAFEVFLKQIEASFNEFQEESKNTQTQRLDALRISQEEAAKIVQAVGNTGLTGNYQKIANNQEKQANIWRWVTIAFFAAGIAVAGATFWKFWHEPFSPENTWSVLIRLMYAFAITAPAWYAAKESARHRSNADRARQTELELASLGPFIELMPEDKKNQIREELTKRYFGNHVPEHKAEPPIGIKDIRELAVELVKAAKR